MKHIFIQILIISSLVLSSNIDSILVSGNYKTNNQIILKQLYQKANTDFENTNIEKDIEQLMQLNVFDDVSIYYSNKIYHIDLKEKKTISYYPLIDKLDGLGWSIGANIHINNIQGSLNHIDIGAAFGAMDIQKINYTKNKLSIKFLNHQYNSIESNYLHYKSIINLSYNVRNYFHIACGLDNHKLNYNNQKLEFDYFNASVKYIISKPTYVIKAQLISNVSNKSRNPNYNKLFFKYDKYLHIKNNNIHSKVLFRSQIVLNTYPENLLLDFENLYFGGDDFVRGYNPNPSDNPSEVSDNLKFRNMIFQSIQFEMPILKNDYFDATLLIFNDFAIGSNNYKKFNEKNKIKGYGFGFSISTMYKMRFDICIGLNKYGSSQMHFMKDFIF